MNSSTAEQPDTLGETRAAWSSTLRSRQRVLLHTQPLVTLQQKWKLGADEQAHYDALTLSIKLFDAIIDGSGFGNEVTRETMLQSLRPLLTAFDKARDLQHDEQRHQQVVDRLIGYLKNDANRGRAFEVEYADYDNSRQLDRKVLRFKLLKEMHGYSGEIVLQLSSEAINLFLNALDLDIESAQEANEAVVRFQLERGKFDQARAFAENARGQSLRYGEKIERIVAQTKRDIRQVDWRNEVHDLLVEAVDHVQNRQRIESEIIGSAQQKLAGTQLDDDQRHAVSDVIRLMRDCRHRHLDLNRQLMQAPNHFFEQQTRQCFSDSEAITPINLRDEVLQPLLAMPQAEAGMRQLPLGASELIDSLGQEFSPEQLESARVLVRQRDNHLVLNPVLVGDAVRCLFQRRTKDEAPFDIVNRNGSLATDDPPAFGSCRDFFTKSWSGDTKLIFVAFSDDDLAVLRMLSMPCTPSAGLAEMNGQQLRRLCDCPDSFQVSASNQVRPAAVASDNYRLIFTSALPIQRRW